MEMQPIALNIIKKFEEIKRRPTMYVRDDVDELLVFLQGFAIACRLCGLKSGFDEVYVSTVEQRGWQWLPSGGVVPSMRENGLTSTQMIQELLTIEIEVWKKRYEIH